MGGGEGLCSGFPGCVSDYTCDKVDLVWSPHGPALSLAPNPAARFGEELKSDNSDQNRLTSQKPLQIELEV